MNTKTEKPTPRTDAEERGDEPPVMWVPSDFARTLERELEELREERDSALTAMNTASNMSARILQRAEAAEQRLKEGVPREPTLGMCVAGDQEIDEQITRGLTDARAIYKAMLSAIASPDGERKKELVHLAGGRAGKKTD